MVTESEIRNVALALWIERGRAAGSEPECRAHAQRLLSLREELTRDGAERVREIPSRALATV